jgi:hypothetical protein
LKIEKKQKYDRLRNGIFFEKIHGGNHIIDTSSHSTIGINTFYYNWRTTSWAMIPSLINFVEPTKS